MGPEAAVNAVYFNKIQERPEAERAAYVQELRDAYKADIDIEKLASELVVDAVVPGARLRDEVARRFRYHALGYEPPTARKRAVLPV
jgi:acetyl-CoA carboxylase carboxyltransferase component